MARKLEYRVGIACWFHASRTSVSMSRPGAEYWQHHTDAHVTCCSQGAAVIRPIAFRPLQGAMSPGPPGSNPHSNRGVRQGAARLSNAGERYGSTPVLTRPGTRLALHGSKYTGCRH